jgi:hypothetical protein|tara:strand:- start:146 stop:1009 length:864 start_codon:yes stop_codon:yes gene_type:complete
MGIYNEFNKKEKPVFTGLKFGFGASSGGGEDDGLNVAADGFGGYPWVGMVTRSGGLSQSAGLEQIKKSGTTPTFGGSTSIVGSSGESNIQNRYAIPNPFGSLIPAQYRNTSFTIIEKFYKNSAIGNYRIGGVRGSNIDIATWTSPDIMLATRYDNRTGGFGGTWGTNYPNFLNAAYINTSGSHPVGSLWRGWRSSMLSWDADTGKVWWAGQDDQNSGNPSIIDTTATKTLSDWQTGIGTQDYVYRSVTVADPMADWYLIYGKAVNNVSDAAEYNMLSTTVFADPYNA